MAIVAALAVPYSVMQDYLTGNPTNRIASMAQNYDKVWIVSITNSDSCPIEAFHGKVDKVPPPLVQDGEDRIALQFEDIEDKYDAYSGIEKPRIPGLIYFDESMARKICEFLKRAHESSPESRDLLVVNCHMGVSRSGAVSDFARTTFGLNYDEWKRMQPQVNPNILVKFHLHWCWKELHSGSIPDTSTSGS
jgi:predicted protein tyrosine phosphatase